MYDAMLAETVTIRGDGGEEIEAYLARPMREGPLGGVVVIHHMPGYDEPTKEIARNFAVHGYNALIPNLYHRVAPGASPDDAAAAPYVVAWAVSAAESGVTLSAPTVAWPGPGQTYRTGLMPACRYTVVLAGTVPRLAPSVVSLNPEALAPGSLRS